MALLAGMAQAMGPLCDQVVFVGGCATGLLLDDAGLLDVRPTEDVDAIVEVASLANYHRLAEQLTQRGFKQTMADNTPPFRWYWNRMQLDLVPLDEKVLGFANRWYRRPEALELLQRPARRRHELRRLRRAAHLPAVPQDGRRAQPPPYNQPSPSPGALRLARAAGQGRRRAVRPLPPHAGASWASSRACSG
jgi:hypothetical protein